jgi:hypothetical protein
VAFFVLRACDNHRILRQLIASLGASSALLVGMIDPLRAGVREAVTDARGGPAGPKAQA